MIRKTTIMLSALVILAAGIGSVIAYRNAQPSENSTTTRSTNKASLRTIADNLNTPWSIAFFNDTALISSRDTGEIHELNGRTGSIRLVGTINESVHNGEGGLLGLVVDEQQRLYAYYTTDADNRISRYSLKGEPGSLSFDNGEVIIDGLPNASFHNGGRIAFGPDELLYVTVGDAGDTRSAQDLSKLSGKILRMTTDGDVPPDNPFADSFVYSYGHRNPQGIAWSDDGIMFATEFGQNTWDELNVIEAGSNYGWPNVEGIKEREGFVAPVQQWTTSDASPSGMTYSNGLLYIANLRGESLRTVPVNDLSQSQVLYKEEFGRIRDAVVSPDGNVWFVTNNTDGRGTPSEIDDRIFSLR